MLGQRVRIESETDIFLEHCQPVEKNQDADDEKENAGGELEDADVLFETVEEFQEAMNCQCGKKERDSKAERINEKKDNAAIYGAFRGSNHED